MPIRSRFVLRIIAALLIPGAAIAQEPQRTTATYDDWTVRCQRDAASKHQCELVQAVHVKGQPGPVSQIAIGRIVERKSMKAVFQVPISVWLPAGVRLVVDDQSSGLAASFKRCLPAACFADVELKDADIKQMRAQSVQGRLEFKDAAQRDITLPISFMGFSRAFDAMTKE